MGMPVILPETIDFIEDKPVPVALSVPLKDLQGFRYLGRHFVPRAVSSRLTRLLPGPSITLRAQDQFWIFLPRAQRHSPGEFASFENGDLVEATGIAAQYCPRPPYNRSFEVLAPGPESVLRKEAAFGWPIIATASGVCLCARCRLRPVGRERRLRGQRERLRKIYQLGRRSSAPRHHEAIWKRIAETLPFHSRNHPHPSLCPQPAQPRRSLMAWRKRARRFHFHFARSRLRPRARKSGAAACFHYRTLLVIPDISRSPFPIASAPFRAALIAALCPRDGARRSHRR